MRQDQALGRDGQDIQLGFAFPHLLHTILSCSALSLYSKQPERIELLDSAYVHQNAALLSVRAHLTDLNKSNIQAVLPFAAIMSVIALAQPLYPHPYRPGQRRDPIDSIVNSFLMTRGIKTILERQWQLEGVSNPNEDLDFDCEDPWGQDLMSKFPPYPVLRSLITEHCTLEADKVVCLDASRKIFSYITFLEEQPDAHQDPRLAQIWPIEIDKRFIDMVSARRPIALLILGYYAALMRMRSETMWPYAAWPSMILHRVDALLGEEWSEHLQWPKDRVLC